MPGLNFVFHATFQLNNLHLHFLLLFVTHLVEVLQKLLYVVSILFAESFEQAGAHVIEAEVDGHFVQTFDELDHFFAEEVS